MREQERVFIRSASNAHPLLVEMPEEFRRLWFHCYENSNTKEKLFLQMERVYQSPSNIGAFAEFLTFEFAEIEDLIEWEEEFPHEKFVAIDPTLTFFDGLDEERGAMFSLGYLDMKAKKFIPELELIVYIDDQGITIDFLDDKKPELWIKLF